MSGKIDKPNKYSAITTIPMSDRFAGGKKIRVEGYYVKHLSATPYPIGTKEEHDKFIADHTKHYIFQDGPSDWGLSRPLQKFEIDIETLEEIK